MVPPPFRRYNRKGRPNRRIPAAQSIILIASVDYTNCYRLMTSTRDRNLAKMLAPGTAKKITIHPNEDTTARHDFLYKEIFAFLREHGVAGATLIRPAAGFGSHHRTHSTDGDAAEGEHLPVRVGLIESREAADRVLPALCNLTTDGLVEVQETVILKTAVRDESL